MNAIVRVAPEDARERVRSGKALLVCAYDDDAKYGRMLLDGSIALSDFKSRTSEITKDEEIIFFCA